MENEILYAVVKQSFVTITQDTDLNKVKIFLEANGFINNRNNDYVNSEIGIIIEDLHDENVLTKNDIHYFIDTFFSLQKNFGLKSATWEISGLNENKWALSSNNCKNERYFFFL